MLKIAKFWDLKSSDNFSANNRFQLFLLGIKRLLHKMLYHILDPSCSYCQKFEVHQELVLFLVFIVQYYFTHGIIF